MALRVRVKATGQTGTLNDESQFDPNVFERVDATVPAPSSAPTPTPSASYKKLTLEDVTKARLNLAPKEYEKVKDVYDLQLAEEKRLEPDTKTKLAKSQIEGLANVLDDLKKDAKGITISNILPSKIGLNSKLQQFETKKALAGQFLAKLVENGRLSDKDREFYQKQIVNLNPLGPQSAKEEFIDSLKETVARLSGFDPSEVSLGKKSEKGKNIVQNTLSDITGLAQSVAGLPKFAGEVAKQAGAVPEVLNQLFRGKLSPGDVGAAVVGGVAQTGKALIEPYAQLANDPLGQFIEKPVSTTLEVLPFLKPAKIATTATGARISSISKVLKAESVAKEAQAITSIVPEAKVIASATAGKIPLSAEGLAARVFKQQFTVPSKIAERVKPLETSAEIIKHGFGAVDLQSSKAIVESITGQNGILSKLVRSAIGEAGEVSIEKVFSSVESLGSRSGVIKDLQVIKNTIGAIIGKQGTKPFTVSADDAITAARELEKLETQFSIAGYNKFNPNLEAQQISKIYGAAADELNIAIDSATTAKNIVQGLKTPEVIDQIRKISPRLANQFLETKSVRDLRSIQAPFVRWGRMIDLTENAAQTPFSKLGKKVLAVPVVGPVIGGVSEAVMPKVQSLAAQKIFQAGQANIPAKLQAILAAAVGR